MANPEHLALLMQSIAMLQQGVEAWNNWRLGNPNIMLDLSEADLHEADLTWTNLRKADLCEANLRGVRLSETTLSNVNLDKVKGLETCSHMGPSVLDFRTLQRSGPLPLAFLRGCGLPDSLIDYLPSLLKSSYYSCFISYSSKDEDFAERLYADLQNTGVRCWFAPKNIQGGRKIHEQIGDAIRLHQKLLLVLSEHSMNSEWVKTEIAEARQLIPDFSNWKSHDAYQQSFDSLLRDLKPALERKPES